VGGLDNGRDGSRWTRRGGGREKGENEENEENEETSEQTEQLMAEAITATFSV
jgi:hypothetical protein